MRVNQRRIMQAMKRLGVSQESIDAEEVIIKTKEKKIVIKNPEVLKVNLMGQDTFQITGVVEELENTYEPNEEDVNIVVEKTGVSKEKAINTLKKNKGDLAASILELSNSEEKGE